MTSTISWKTTFPNELITLAEQVLNRARNSGKKITTAESCTGGLIASLLTEIPGSSAVVDRGFVTYSNQAKMDMLGVPHEMLGEHGAVSSMVAEAMATGALNESNADIAVAVTGIAGPASDDTEKPVGLVYIAIAITEKETAVEKYNFTGDRHKIRMQAVQTALTMLLSKLT